MGLDLAAGPGVSVVVGVLVVGTVLASAASLVARWRGSSGVGRQQLKWVLLGVGATRLLGVAARLVTAPHSLATRTEY